MSALPLLHAVTHRLCADGVPLQNTPDLPRLLRVVLRCAPPARGEVLVLCALREVAGVPFSTSLAALRAAVDDACGGADEGVAGDLPALEEVQAVWEDGRWVRAWTRFCRAREERERVRKEASGLFSSWFVVFVPVDRFGVKSMELQLANVVRHRGGRGVVCKDMSGGELSLSREALGDSRLAVVCDDAILARKLVRHPSQNSSYDVYRTAWVPDCDLQNKILSSRAYACCLAEFTTPQSRPSPVFEAEVALLASRASTAFSPNLTAESEQLQRRAGDARRVDDADPVAKMLDFSEDDGDRAQGRDEPPRKRRRHVDVSKFFCQQSAAKDAENVEYFPNNQLICEAFTELATHYELNGKSIPNANFKVRGFRAAVNFIRRLDYDLTTVQACDSLVADPSARPIGGKIGERMKEIVRFGELQEAKSLKDSGAFSAIRELCGVWGVGPVKAGRLVAQGVNNVASLRREIRRDPGVLDRQQKIGLRHYEDLLERIPRDEVRQIEDCVRERVNGIAPGGVVTVTVAGSYLRGASSCGDVDLMLSGNRKTVTSVLRALVESLASDEILTDALVYGGSKFFGVIRLKPGMKHRRLDLFAVSNDEYAFALLTYTGSGIFNRSMRCLAGRNGLSLSHKGMSRVVRHRDGKTKSGAPIACATERDIFDFLGMEYVEPQDRSRSR